MFTEVRSRAGTVRVATVGGVTHGQSDPAVTGVGLDETVTLGAVWVRERLRRRVGRTDRGVLAEQVQPLRP